MKRLAVLFLAALISTTSLSSAVAQDRAGVQRAPRERPMVRPEAPSRPQFDRDRSDDRRISASEALSIARSRARGANFVGARPSGGSSYVFRFERDGGQLFDVTVDARTGRAGGG
jgi:uncharacterized membrane protein YkoI